MDRTLEKHSIGSYKGFLNEKKNIFFWPSSKIFFILLSLKTTWKNRNSSNTGPVGAQYYVRNMVVCYMTMGLVYPRMSM